MALIFAPFLKLIDNKNCWWKFQIIGDLTFTGQVTDYMMDLRGQPITIMIRSEDRNIMDIPWTSIQFISPAKTENY